MFFKKWPIFFNKKKKNVFVVGSAASLEHAQKLVNTGMATPRKYESDIEIISNPSQSSIEVLDEYGRFVVKVFPIFKFFYYNNV